MESFDWIIWFGEIFYLEDRIKAEVALLYVILQSCPEFPEAEAAAKMQYSFQLLEMPFEVIKWQSTLLKQFMVLFCLDKNYVVSAEQSFSLK